MWPSDKNVWRPLSQGNGDLIKQAHRKCRLKAKKRTRPTSAIFAAKQPGDGKFMHNATANKGSTYTRAQ